MLNTYAGRASNFIRISNEDVNAVHEVGNSLHLHVLICFLFIYYFKKRILKIWFLEQHQLYVRSLRLSLCHVLSLVPNNQGCKMHELNYHI